MKTLLTQEICSRMKSHLSVEQNKILESTLTQIFDVLEFQDSPGPLPQIDSRENTYLINLFIAAKKNRGLFRKHSQILFEYPYENSKHDSQKHTQHRNK